MNGVAGKILREPLLHFVVLAGGLYALSASAPQDTAAPARPVLTAPSEALAQAHQRRHGRVPSAEELNGLEERWVREEALYREAIRLGLDRDDAIVRQRMVQKMRFIVAGIAPDDTPSEDTLRRFASARPERYARPTKRRLRHVFFSTRLRADSAKQDAARFAAAPDSVSGDRHVQGETFEAISDADIARRFGSGFAHAVTAASPGVWTGPVRTATGYHVIYQEIAAAPENTSDSDSGSDVTARVLADWRKVRRTELTIAYEARLLARYGVVQ